MSLRQVTDWLSTYNEYTKDTEPPVSYHTWTGICLIAAALQRKVYITWGHETIYPNMYIILVGPSGRCRKGTAMALGKEILQKVGVKLTSESITREALIRNMKRASANFQEPDTGKVIFHSSLTAFSPELSVFLGQSDVKFLADLTDWYDSTNQWTYETKGAGTDQIQGVCFNLLGATAPDWLQSILPSEAVGGGFTSRIIFVVEENKRKTIPTPVVSKRMRQLREQLVGDLEKIHVMAGEFVFTDEVKEIYSSWYQEQDINAKKGKMAVDDERFSGYCERRATHIRKLCTIYSASRGDDYLIITNDFQRALKTLKSVEKNMSKVFSGLGSAMYARITEKVLEYIRSKKQTTRSELLMQFYRDLDFTTLGIVEETLSAMKVIRIKHDTRNSEVKYEWISK